MGDICNVGVPYGKGECDSFVKDGPFPNFSRYHSAIISDANE